MRRRWLLGRPPLDVPFELNTDSPQAEGLVAWYPTLGSRGANVLRDYAGRGLDGAFPGGAANPSWVGDGRLGSALNFDGDYVTIADCDSLDLPGDITIAAWVRPVGGVISLLMAKTQPVHTTTANANYAISIRDTLRVMAYFGDGVNYRYNYPAVALTANIWAHLAVVFSGSDSIDIYFNGVEQTPAMVGTATSKLTNSYPLIIGNLLTSGYAYPGRLADIRIHNVALSPNVISQMYHKPWGLYRPLRSRGRWAAIVAAWRRHMSMMGVSTELPTS